MHMINHQKMIFIALSLFSLIALLPNANAATNYPVQSTTMTPKAVSAKLYTCPTLAPGTAYTTGSWDCGSMEDAGSCNYGDMVIGLYSYTVAVWYPPFYKYKCEWRCRVKYVPNCGWQ